MPSRGTYGGARPQLSNFLNNIVSHGEDDYQKQFNS